MTLMIFDNSTNNRHASKEPVISIKNNKGQSRITFSRSAQKFLQLNEEEGVLFVYDADLRKWFLARDEVKNGALNLYKSRDTNMSLNNKTIVKELCKSFKNDDFKLIINQKPTTKEGYMLFELSFYQANKKQAV